MKKGIFLLAVCFMCLGFMSLADAEQTLMSMKADKAPAFDSENVDPLWGQAPAVITHDPIADIDATLKSVYTDKEIFFLVQFPDPDESRLHKPWIWNRDAGMYDRGADREDAFILKWCLNPPDFDLSIYADQDYDADVWFWKAERTDLAGFADDKIQRLTSVAYPKSKSLESKSGKPMHLRRQGDQGTPAYEESIFAEYKGDVMHRFQPAVPTGSRADIRAKGFWKDGQWTLIFRRALITGHEDDVQFDIEKTYPFGISRYEIAGRKENPEISQPLYGSGDVSEKIILEFMK